ncbi:formyl transferase [Nitrospina gracilis]|uniref:formyl transferase n=1 Tax=Nitrospina gracilis TaxID=35801 RepID=UPI001F2EDCCA|nr:formyl transferase [Nitrospina gracilis]MCF8720911.1 methionyl-tRNA formyltransferase [Nitrospina gracilis Nb-211]
MQSPRLVLVTGDDLRHEYFIRRINARFAVHSVFAESKHYPSQPFATKEAERAWLWFFERRQEYEQREFAPVRDWPRANHPVYETLQPGDLHVDSFLKKLKRIDPDLILLFDCGLVGQSLLNAFPGRILNLHVGLTEEYRGSSCNFWPIHDERLDCLGATILKIDPGIDTGAILEQGTVTVEPGDDEQSLIGKTLKLGVELMEKVVSQWRSGGWKARPPESPGVLFQRKDLNPEAMLTVRRLVEGPRWQSLLEQYSG